MSVACQVCCQHSLGRCCQKDVPVGQDAHNPQGAAESSCQRCNKTVPLALSIHAHQKSLFADGYRWLHKFVIPGFGITAVASGFDTCSLMKGGRVCA